MWRDLENWLTTLRLFTGVIVEKTRSAMETAQLAVGLFRYFQKDWKDHRSHLNFYHSGPGTAIFHKPNVVMRVAKEYDGIGWEKAMEFSHKFKTPRDFHNASIKDYMEVTGIGKTLATRIHNEVNTGVTREKKQD
jgi:ERCC4-type nuclease